MGNLHAHGLRADSPAPFRRAAPGGAGGFDGQLPSDRLDKDNRNRDYLYGRLLALADLAEYEAIDRLERARAAHERRPTDAALCSTSQADMAASARQTLALSRHAGQRRQSGGLYAHDR